MLKKKISCIMAAIMLVGAAAGCGNVKTGSNGGKVTLKVSNWPNETNTAEVAVYDQYVKMMNEQYPNIEVVKDTYAYDTKTFFTMASSGQLPTIYMPPLTEIKKIVDSGYAADLTKYMKDYNYVENLNPTLKDTVTVDDKYYAVPTNVYAIGLFCNKKMFKQAGLVNEDGTIKCPSTYEELAQTAKTIKEKTGQAGFATGTMNNVGGWLFMETAWSHGVKFEEEVDGKWKAAFNSKECIDALQYIKDLKWKYDALPDNTFVDQKELRKLFATGQTAMYFATPPEKALVRDYGMSKDDIYVGRVPEGPAGRYSQMGGQVCMISPTATPEEIDAAFKWLEISGKSPKVTEQAISGLDTELKAANESGWIVTPKNFFDILVNKDRLDAENEVRTKYTNVDTKDFEDYFSFDGVIVKPEESEECQALYGTLDSMIQAVLTDKNADVPSIIEKAANDFQVNNLNNVK